MCTYVHIIGNVVINYQFNNFFLENYPTPARRLVAVMRKIVELEPYTTTPFNTDQIIMFKNCVEYYESVKNKEEVLANFEKEEPIYWSHVLGRAAAIEILSLGRTSPKTMEQMSLLPFHDFEECVRICNKYAAMVTEITEGVEQEIAAAGMGHPA